ncbi:MAG: type II secretion system protein [Pseudomonadota bacterium]|nr:type II secretion system protein [Pseudomonadota bacterium]
MKGFSLLETLVAMMILSFSLIIISSTWGGNVLRLRKARLYNEVTFLLQQKMTEMELKYQNAPLEKIDEEDTGDFGKDFPDYKWEFNSQEFTMPDLASLLTSEKDRVSDMETSIVKQLTEVLSKSIKEIKVTVIVLKKGKEIKRYALTSYIVDYNKDIALSPSGAGK